MENLNYPTQTDKDILLKSIVASHITTVEARNRLQNLLSSGARADKVFSMLIETHHSFGLLHGFARIKVWDKLSEEERKAVTAFITIDFNANFTADKSKPYSGRLSNKENIVFIKDMAINFIQLFDKYQDAMQKAGIGGL